jgi:hypothetical protein
MVWLWTAGTSTGDDGISCCSPSSVLCRSYLASECCRLTFSLRSRLPSCWPSHGWCSWLLLVIAPCVSSVQDVENGFSRSGGITKSLRDDASTAGCPKYAAPMMYARADIEGITVVTSGLGWAFRKSRHRDLAALPSQVSLTHRRGLSILCFREPGHPCGFEVLEGWNVQLRSGLR